MTKQDFAKRLCISRPTLDKWLEDYDRTGIVPKQYAQDIFDAFFKYGEERNNSMEGSYRCVNNNVLVRLVEDTAVNKNGTRVVNTETRGKRDVVVGEVLVSENIKQGSLVYFSFYAAQPFSLEGEQVLCVNYHDIKFIKTK